MEAKRAQELLRLIINTDNYGLAALKEATIEEAVCMVSNVLPECMQLATDKRVDNDIAYFAEAIRVLRAYVIDRLKDQDELWVVYNGLTGYPYYVDGALVVFYNYENRKGVEDILRKAGHMVETGVVTPQTFKYEIGHMYRNGYDTVIFADGTEVMFKVSREEIYPYENYYADDYIMNPDLQAAMIDYFQESRKNLPKEQVAELLAKREEKMFKVMMDAEFIVPCLKEETEDSIEVAHPFIDLAKERDSETPIIAIPAFTDGFEMNKCYGDHRDNVMYKFGGLVELVQEVEANGVVINYMGERFFMDLNMLKTVYEKYSE